MDRGLAISAPTRVLDLVEAFGAGYGLKMEADCKVGISPLAKEGGAKTVGAGN